MTGADRTPGQGAGRGRDDGSAPGADDGPEPEPGMAEPGMAERRRIVLEQGRKRFAALERARGEAPDLPGCGSRGGGSRGGGARGGGAGASTAVSRPDTAPDSG